jgi:hypothetical protein
MLILTVTVGQNNLGCLTMTILFFQASLIFVSESLQSGAPHRTPSMGSFGTNLTSQTKFPLTNALAYFTPSSVTKKKRFPTSIPGWPVCPSVASATPCSKLCHLRGVSLHGNLVTEQHPGAKDINCFSSSATLPARVCVHPSPMLVGKAQSFRMAN